MRGSVRVSICLAASRRQDRGKYEEDNTILYTILMNVFLDGTTIRKALLTLVF